ncbi:translational GTPase TypA [Tissierella creatinophila]|uniref:Large ribosomal subunit assembly factor BipA n=1 Tax=Tissierella creatinophila DSM 6911 TaxID=1123403 RepID=A0A1U7M410_TISCR|nr:translational GTPase TypA [Tissierella creatinophila]OLS02054.1 GTP-binding protein TypA/BipA [Tissierella creatinophila DSM 6911]
MTTERKDIRNIAIIAHVDHGKTTLVDSLLKQSGVFRENQDVLDRVMDSGDIERERGITILSKNTAVHYGDTKINIIDTPGHADFGGEVERVLNMVNGVVILVDAFEGPMPQTKFVLKKALELKHPVIVCINKIDRPEARPEAVIDEVLDLFIELGADENQLECPFVYTSAKQGTSSLDPNKQEENMKALFETIIEYIPAPVGDPNEPLQVLISTIDYNEYVGRIGVGKIERGTINVNQDAILLNKLDENKKQKIRIGKLYEFEGLDKVEVQSAKAGSIIAIAGITDINIGDTICPTDHPEALSFVKISEPTLAMTFSVNNSPFAGREGKFVTSRQIRNRLYKELQTDVGLRVEDTELTDAFKVSGRGELHLSVLIETMRREGYEFQISKPEVLFKEENGKKMEPIERVIIDVSNDFVGAVIEKLGQRKGELVSMTEPTGGYARLEFTIPSRGLIGYRQEFMTDTKGNGIINTIFDKYAPYKGDIPRRKVGSIIAFETGESTAYGLHAAQSRGVLFLGAGVPVYAGMVIGENPKGQDMEVNIVKKKQQSNVRASGSDESLRLSPPNIMSLEEALEFIEDDELIEITPLSFRIRKRILEANKRYKSRK